MKSIQTRMVWSYLLLIVLVVGVLGTTFIAVMWNFYYGGSQSAVKQRVESAFAMHGRSLASLTLDGQADYLLQYLTDSGATRLQLLDQSGSIRIDSDGYAPEFRYQTADVRMALAGQLSDWSGIDPYYGERVVAVTLPIWNESKIVSLLRYTSSLKQVDEMIKSLIQMTALTAFGVVLLFLGLSLFLAQRIVRPIRELTRAARYMAEGDWTRRAIKRGDDEIAQLADTFNSMVSELNKREKMKNDFISSISHELRTPLTSIKGWSETLNEGSDGSKLDEQEMGMGLAIISKETERLSGLVEDLLDFSKLSAKTLQLYTEMLDINTIVKETVKQLKVREETTKVQLLAAYSDEILMARIDANRFKQVMINLIDNAFKFTEAGGFIKISTHTERNKVRIVVADTGSGIESSHMPHVLEKFYKGNVVQAGSGLGLAICKEIVELHGGSIAMESKKGEGTTVFIELPLVTQEK